MSNFLGLLQQQISTHLDYIRFPDCNQEVPRSRFNIMYRYGKYGKNFREKTHCTPGSLQAAASKCQKMTLVQSVHHQFACRLDCLIR